MVISLIDNHEFSTSKTNLTTWLGSKKLVVFEIYPKVNIELIQFGPWISCGVSIIRQFVFHQREVKEN